MNLTLIAAIFSGVLAAQQVKVGQILIASKASRDPDFSRTVIVVVHATPQGVAGLMLNRPSDAAMSRVLPNYRARGASPTVYAGGPVAMGTNTLVRSRSAVPRASRLSGDLWLVTDPSEAAKLLDRSPGDVRVYIGLCGWSRRQMEDEMRRGLWIVSLADSSLVFDSKPETLWTRLVERLTR